jgi:hypothetical protein
MIIHTFLNCAECKFRSQGDDGYPMCGYLDRPLNFNEMGKTIPDWCELRKNAVLVMTDPNKLRKDE